MLRNVLAGWMALALSVSAVRAEESAAPKADELKARITRLLRGLDAPLFADRRRAEAELLSIGPAVLPALLEAERSPSAEVRTRAGRIARRIDDREIGRAFDRLGRAKLDEDIDVEESLWLLCRIVDPLATREQLTRELDALAAEVRKELAPTEPRKADPRRVMDALREVLHVRRGLTGNMGNYDDIANSSALAVLNSKHGLPIILSEIVVAVGRRLDLPLVGLAIPTRYMVKYDGKRGPAGYAGGDLAIDCFKGFRLYATTEELATTLLAEGIELDPDEHLRAAPHRETVARMLNNLAMDYAQAGKLEKSAQVASYLALVDRGGELEEILEDP